MKIKKDCIFLMILLLISVNFILVKADSVDEPFLMELANDTFNYLSSSWATSNDMPWSWRSNNISGGDYANTAEIGFYMASWIGAYELGQGWKPSWSTVEAELNSVLDRLEAWQSETQSYQPNGNNSYNQSVFYQWYWISYSPPVVGSTAGTNQYVPSLDNAWLAASLFFIKEYAKAHNNLTLAGKAEAVLYDMNFSVWYDKADGLFYSGSYRDPRIGFKYDYYSNENRIINYMAFILGQFNESEFLFSLDKLTQPTRDYNGITVEKVNWDGSYFTYASPALFINETSLPYGNNTLHPATLSQIKYALEEKGYGAWGHSDCYYTGSGGYVGRGAPPRGSDDINTEVGDELISPHVSGLALITPYAFNATENLKFIANNATSSYDARYGFKDCVNVTSGKISYRFTSLNQEWMFLGLINYFNGTIWKYMYNNESVRRLHELLNTTANCTDNDGDGYNASNCGQADCNDSNYSIYPNADENCTNSVDDNCNSKIDGADIDCMEGCVTPYSKVVIKRNVTFCKSGYGSIYNITVANDSIAIDCNGSSFDGSFSGISFKITSRNNTKLSNCTISRYWQGIRMESSSNNVLSHINCPDNNNYCIVLLKRSHNNTIINSSINYSYDSGLHIEDSDGNKVEHNTFFYNQWRNGIHLKNADFNFIAYNSIGMNGNTGSWYFRGGIALLDSYNNTIEDNAIIENKAYGIYARDTKDNIIKDNRIANNTFYGMELYDIDNFSISNNTIVNNSNYGIYYQKASRESSIANNTLIGNKNYDFYNGGSSDVTVEGNWWGTVNCSEIDKRIYDKNDSAFNGKADYLPFLNESYPLGKPRHCASAILPLVKGWNLISLPIQPENRSIAALFNNTNATAIYTFNSTQWLYYLNNTNNNMREIGSPMGFWIGLQSPMNLEVNGKELGNVSYKLSKGHNIISYPSLEEGNASALFENVNVTNVFVYENKTWKSFSKEKPDAFNSLKVVKPGQGVIVSVPNDVNWTFNGSKFAG